MIAKGLDFPNVTLVGVIQADTALHLPDFRAAERTFHLVTQVAGRTGRGDKGGRVLVQTFSPDHPAIRSAVRHDYAAFAAQELPLREMLHYPPFAAMIRLVIRGESEALAKEFAQRLGQSVSAALEARQAQARVLGPAPAPTPRIRGKYRFQIQIQGPDGDKLRAAVREAESQVHARRRRVDCRRRPDQYALSEFGVRRFIAAFGRFVGLFLLWQRNAKPCDPQIKMKAAINRRTPNSPSARPSDWRKIDLHGLQLSQTHLRRDQAGTETAVSVRRRAVGDHRDGVLVVWHASTADLVYEQNRNTAQLVLQEHMVATHLGADKIQFDSPRLPSSFPEEVKEERQWIELQKKQFSKHAGEGQVDLVARASRRRSPDDQEEADICQKFLKPPAPAFQAGRAQEDRVQGIDRRARVPLLRADPPAAGHLSDEWCHTPPLGGPGIDAMGSAVGVSPAGGVSSPATPTQTGRRDGDRQGHHFRGRDAGEAQRK